MQTNHSMKQENPDWQHGLSLGHIAQIVRRKMTTRTKPSAKAYKREKFKTRFSD